MRDQHMWSSWQLLTSNGVQTERRLHIPPRRGPPVGCHGIVPALCAAILSNEGVARRHGFRFDVWLASVELVKRRRKQKMHLK